MSIDKTIKKVMILGSGPIVIGQAAEFDYAGTQACKTLKEEGISVILVNSNPATIMTDSNIVDKLYIEPLTVDMVEKIIEKEKPDSILPTFGGQIALNLVVELEQKGSLEKNNVRVLGTSVEAIRRTENRLKFKKELEKINQPCVQSELIVDLEQGKAFVKQIGYPVIVRPSYTLGGSGSGIAYNDKEFEEILSRGLEISMVGQCLVEKSIMGWKEIEYEVVRDNKGNSIVICNMENMDPVGIHTGDSIVTAPVQTISDKINQKLRSASLKIVESLNIIGGCNVQFALNQNSNEYCVIEVNPRMSRSSALASKATGYPIAKVASKIAIGYNLDEIINGITGKTTAFFEPVLDYIVVKIPRWPFDKFKKAENNLTTHMKSTGEAMAICVNFEGALMKALRSLDVGIYSLNHIDYSNVTDEEIEYALHFVDNKRIFVIAEAIRRGIKLEIINQITSIDIWFLKKIANIVSVEIELKKGLNKNVLIKAKMIEYPDIAIAKLVNKEEEYIYSLRKKYNILAAYNMVDTCAGEFEATTPYYYSFYSKDIKGKKQIKQIKDHTSNKKILVIGAGPIKIGQGVEFDYCAVHCIWALKNEGYDTIIVNNNPETVSTDYDIADKLYFEPLVMEDLENIINYEKPYGVIVQFGGQVALKMAKELKRKGIKIIGTSAEDIDISEDRKLFEEVLRKCKIKKPIGKGVSCKSEALELANAIGYPVLIRPSYVLGGSGMCIARSEMDVIEYLEEMGINEEIDTILIDKYIDGVEYDMDVISDGVDIFIPGVIEHIERAGIHSGDSILIYPPQNMETHNFNMMKEYAKKLAQELHVKGIMNIQFIIFNNCVYVIEVNLRSSRTVPFISKVTGINMVNLATKVIMGKTINELQFLIDKKKTRLVAVKMPVFSFDKIRGADTCLGPEMKSTGEVLGISNDYYEAVYKAFLGAGIDLRKKCYNILVSFKDEDKLESIELVKKLKNMGMTIYATNGTWRFLNEYGIKTLEIDKRADNRSCMEEIIKKGIIDCIINTPTRGENKNRMGYFIRCLAVDYGITCITSIDTAKIYIDCLQYNYNELSIVDMSNI